MYVSLSLLSNARPKVVHMWGRPSETEDEGDRGGGGLKAGRTSGLGLGVGRWQRESPGGRGQSAKLLLAAAASTTRTVLASTLA